MSVGAVSPWGDELDDFDVPATLAAAGQGVSDRHLVEVRALAVDLHFAVLYSGEPERGPLEPLAPLAPAAVRSVLEDRVGAGVPDQVVAELTERTGGNPLAVVEAPTQLSAPSCPAATCCDPPTTLTASCGWSIAPTPALGCPSYDREWRGMSPLPVSRAPTSVVSCSRATAPGC